MKVRRTGSTGRRPWAAARPGLPDDRGFTLIELLVVILIAGILAAVAVPIFLSALDQARASSTQAALATARLAVALTVVEEGQLPTLAERDAILAAADPAVTLDMTGAGTDFCLVATHDQLADTWASTERVVPTQGASCAPDGSIVLP